MNYDQIVYEVLGSLQSVAYYSHRQSHMFSYPVGHYDDFALSVLSEMPIWRAVTTQPGALQTTDNILELPRVRVPGGATADTLAALLREN